jgi:hypothetical protein
MNIFIMIVGPVLMSAWSRPMISDLGLIVLMELSLFWYGYPLG